MTYSYSSYQLVTSFSAFLIFFLAKIVSHYEVHVIFLGIEHQLQENITHRFFHYNSV